MLHMILFLTVQLGTFVKLRTQTRYKTKVITMKHTCPTVKTSTSVKFLYYSYDTKELTYQIIHNLLILNTVISVGSEMSQSIKVKNVNVTIHNVIRMVKIWHLRFDVVDLKYMYFTTWICSR